MEKQYFFIDRGKITDFTDEAYGKSERKEHRGRGQRIYNLGNGTEIVVSDANSPHIGTITPEGYASIEIEAEKKEDIEKVRKKIESSLELKLFPVPRE
jgi:hypothetical protein